jgi:hypothetical protein
MDAAPDSSQPIFDFLPGVAVGGNMQPGRIGTMKAGIMV